MIQRFLHEHRQFIYLSSTLSILIIMMIIGGSYTRETYIEPKDASSRAEKIAQKLREEERAQLFDTSLFYSYRMLTFDLPEVSIQYGPETPLTSPGKSSPDQLIRFLTSRNPRIDKNFISKIVDAYISDCALEGINHDVAFSQMCLETGYLRSNGLIRTGQYNFCGLGITKTGEIGVCFPTIENGVRAHIQHLKAYASKDPLVTNLIDTRFELVKRGSAREIKDLAGTWAEDKLYAEKMEIILKQLLASSALTASVRKGT